MLTYYQMKKLYTTLMTLLCAALCHAQVNMVPNCSFEQYSICPNAFSQITNSNGWNMFTNGSSDFFHSCATVTQIDVPTNTFGTEPAAHGDAYAGFYAGTNTSSYKEYISRAITPLTVGHMYSVTIYASLADNSTHGTDDLGVFFWQNGPASYATTANPAVTPQVTYASLGAVTNKVGWTKLTKTFVADSPYANIAIGCFSANTAMNMTATPPGTLPSYYYVDSISIVLANGIIMNPVSTMMCRGDVIQVPFTLVGGGTFYLPSNIFTLQMSDAFGSFTTPVNIGTLAGNTAGTITGTVPVGTATGTGYKFRIVSSNNADTSAASADVSIGNIIPVKPVASANTPLCTSTGNLNLTATTTTGGVTWSWTGPQSFTSNLQNPSIATPGTLASGNYIVEASIYGCKSEKDTVTVNVYQTPPQIYAGSNSPVCAGQGINLTSTITSPGVTWSWAGPASYTANTQNPVRANATTAMSGTYTVTATENGCSVTSTVAVQVNPTPIASATGNTVLCEGETLNMTATSSEPGAGYTWSGPLGYTSNTAVATRGAVTVPMSGNYIVTANIGVCTSSYTLPVVVNPLPVVPTVGSNSPACNQLNLTATSSPGATYAWTGPAAFTSNLQNPVILNATPGNSGTYTVIASLGNCHSAPATLQAIVNPKPYLGAYASPNDTVCDGTVVTFVTVPMNGVVNPTFQWFKNNVAVPGATSLTYVGPYATGDTFYCRTFAQDLCANNITLYSNKMGMVVLPIINTLSASISSTPTLPLPGQTIDFMCTVVSGGYLPVFQWRKNGQDIFGAIHANWSANNLMPYDEISCKVTTSDPCAQPKETMSNTVIINFPTGINNMHEGDDITLYPNPNNGSFRLKSDKLIIKHIEVLNGLGQKVYETTVANQKELDIALPQLANGVYVIKMETDGGVAQKRFTLQR